MFTNFTLCPHGAFMMHESVAEFDPNVPVDAGKEEAQNQQIRAELTAKPAYCPIDAIMHKLKPIYDQVQSLYTTELQYEYKEDLIRMLDQCSKTASDVTEAMEVCLVKHTALYDFVNTTKWTSEPLLNNGAFFMKNLKRLHTDGYDQVSVMYEFLPEINTYDICTKLRVFMNMDDVLPQLPADPLNFEGCYQSTSRFTSTMEFFNTFFNDQEKLMRLIRSDCRTFDIPEMIQSIGYNSAYARPTNCAEDNFLKALMAWMSCTLRAVKTEIYNVECDLMDPDGKMEMNDTKMTRRLVSATINLFIVPALYLIATSFDMKNGFMLRETLTKYVNEVMDHYGYKSL